MFPWISPQHYLDFSSNVHRRHDFSHHGDSDVLRRHDFSHHGDSNMHRRHDNSHHGDSNVHNRHDLFQHVDSNGVRQHGFTQKTDFNVQHQQRSVMCYNKGANSSSVQNTSHGHGLFCSGTDATYTYQKYGNRMYLKDGDKAQAAPFGYQEQPLVAMATTQPRNASEWQLYKVLQRANLLQYYDTFIAQGGDDVQQLCEAGEEEFLEIMALVGMASKPLHVRRLQKALQEWVANPTAFQNTPQSATQSTSLLSTSPVPTATALPTVVATPTRQEPVASAFTVHSPSNSSVWKQEVVTVQRSVSPVPVSTPSSGQDDSKDVEKRNSTSPTPTPILIDTQISAIADAAAKLAKELPPFDAKNLNMKKPINREIMNVMQMSDDDPARLDLLRKYAAIYGRFDSKRKSEKPMSLHEISVNEASAQLCRHMPTLLTRREDLFPLARQVVRDSGYQYSKGHSRANPTIGITPSAKRPRLDMGFIQMYMNLCTSNPSMMKNMVDSDKMTSLSEELTIATQKQEELKTEIQAAKDANKEDLVQSLTAELEQATARQLQLYTEQSELIRKSRRLGVGGFEDDGLEMPSGNSSPTNSGDGEDFNQQVRQHLYASLAAQNKSAAQMQNTLFDEGLRIAQQYGMADFAEELKGLQDDDNSGDDEDSKSNLDLANSEHSNDGGKNGTCSSRNVNSRESIGFSTNGINGLVNVKSEPGEEGSNKAAS